MRNQPYLALFAGLFLLVPALASARSAPGNSYQSMVAKLDSLKTYQATVHSTISLQPVNGQGRPNTIHSVETIIYERPNKLSVKAEGLMGGMQVVSNGKTMYQYSALANQYTAKPAPANLLRVILGNGAGREADFKEVGTSTVDGVPVVEMKGTQSTPQGLAETMLYIGEANHLPYRAVFVLPHLPGQEGSAFRMVTTQDFTSEKVNAAVPSSAFRFVPPANSIRVSSLAFGGQGGAGGGFPGLP